MKMFKWSIPLVAALSLTVMQPTLGNAESCADIAGLVAADYGGELLSVTAVDEGGSASCKITILIRSSDGGPARKKTVIVPK